MAGKASLLRRKNAIPAIPFDAESDVAQFSRMTPVETILARHAGRRGALLPILHDIQAAHGHIDDAAIATVAQALNLSRADVHGVVSFYHDFRRAPVSAPVTQQCRAEACQARGMAIDPEAEAVFCLGLCAVGPAMLRDGVPEVPRRGSHTGSRAANGAGRTVRISADMASVALGADDLAAAFAAAGCSVVRTGSRGLFSIEPLVEIE